MTTRCNLCGDEINYSLNEKRCQNSACALCNWTDAAVFDRIQKALAFDTIRNRAIVTAVTLKKKHGKVFLKKTLYNA